MLLGDFDLPTTHAVDILSRACARVRATVERRDQHQSARGKTAQGGRTRLFRFDFVLLGFLTTRETLLELQFLICKGSIEISPGRRKERERRTTLDLSWGGLPSKT